MHGSMHGCVPMDAEGFPLLSGIWPDTLLTNATTEEAHDKNR